MQLRNQCQSHFRVILPTRRFRDHRRSNRCHKGVNFRPWLFRYRMITTLQLEWHWHEHRKKKRIPLQSVLPYLATMTPSTRCVVKRGTS